MTSKLGRGNQATTQAPWQPSYSLPFSRNAPRNRPDGRRDCYPLSPHCALSMDDQNKLLHGLIDNRSVEQAENYIRRGRRLARKDDAYLKHAWIGAMKLWSVNLANAVDHELREDLQSEMLLRGYEPPFESVKDIIEILHANSDVPVANLKPEREPTGAKINRETQDLRDSFKRRSKG
jgi:hypothetical protein